MFHGESNSVFRIKVIVPPLVCAHKALAAPKLKNHYYQLKRNPRGNKFHFPYINKMKLQLTTRFSAHPPHFSFKSLRLSSSGMHLWQGSRRSTRECQRNLIYSRFFGKKSSRRARIIREASDWHVGMSDLDLNFSDLTFLQLEFRVCFLQGATLSPINLLHCFADHNERPNRICTIISSIYLFEFVGMISLDRNH